MIGAAARPVAAGYVVVPDGLDSGDMERLVHRWGDALGRHAAREGYALGAVFTDVPGRGEPGLYDLVAHVRQGRATAVVVPDLPTLTRSACLADTDRLTAARFLRAPVLTVDPADPRPVDPSPTDPGLAYATPAETTPAARPTVARPGGGYGPPAPAGRHSAAPAGRHSAASAHPKLRRADRLKGWW